MYWIQVLYMVLPNLNAMAVVNSTQHLSTICVGVLQQLLVDLVDQASVASE